MRPSLLNTALVTATCVFATAASAQVAGVGYTIAPRAGYLFPSDNSGLKNQFAIGADLGFSFGQFIELRANYIQGIGGATDLERLGEDLLDGNLPDERDVNVRRIGGDVKFNLGRGAFLPYVLVGTGIQTLELEDDLEENLENENIYGNAGIGFVLSAADRYTFFVEGRYLQYRNNAFQALTTDLDRTEIGINTIDGANRRVGNYSIEAGAAFYLGGRRPGEMTELDRAYADQFGDGFRGVTLEIEPTLSRINFDDASPFRDTWLGGAALGFNFGPLVGIRGYYLRAMQDDKINLDFDDLAVYGLDMRFNLNSVQTGLAPFLTVGGGYIDPRGGYRGNFEIDDVELGGTGFASGGGGVVLGLTRNLRVRGSYKALLTTASELDPDELITTDQINVSNQFSVGLDLAIGRKARDGNEILAERTAEAMETQRERDLAQRDSLLSRQDSLFEMRMARRDSIAEARLARSQNVRDSIRTSYEQELAQREEELNEAIAARDRVQIDSMRSLVEETEDLLSEIEDADAASRQRTRDRQRLRQQDLEMRTRDGFANDPYVEERYVRDEYGNLRVERQYREPQAQQRGGTIRMSVSEFEGLIEEIFESSLPMGPEAFAPANRPDRNYERSYDPAYVPSNGGYTPYNRDDVPTNRADVPSAQYRFDPMTGEPIRPRDLDSDATRRENEQLRRELDRLRRDMDNVRRGGNVDDANDQTDEAEFRRAPEPTRPQQTRTEPRRSSAPSTRRPGEDPGTTVLDEVGIRPEEPMEKRPENRDGDGVTILDEVGIREEEAADRTDAMPDEEGVVRLGTTEPEPREETRKERRARERAERKARKERENGEDDGGDR